MHTTPPNIDLTWILYAFHYSDSATCPEQVHYSLTWHWPNLNPVCLSYSFCDPTLTCPPQSDLNAFHSGFATCSEQAHYSLIWLNIFRVVLWLVLHTWRCGSACCLVEPWLTSSSPGALCLSPWFESFSSFLVCMQRGIRIFLPGHFPSVDQLYRRPMYK